MLNIIQNQIGVDKNRLGGKASRIWEDAVENMQESGEKEELGVFWDICQYWIPAGDEILILASSRIFRFFFWFNLQVRHMRELRKMKSADL